MKKKITLCGYGNVAFEFVKLLNEKRDFINERYGIYLIIDRIILKDGMLHEEDGINLEKLINKGRGSQGVKDYGKLVKSSVEGDILVDLSPTNIETGEPSKSYIISAINNNMNVVTASKGALVLNYTEINKKAKENGTKILFSGATAAALPTLDIGENSLCGTNITSIRGILNGTSNYILTKIFEDNISMEEALKEAQEKGIAEKNSSLDIKGFDTACKILLIVNKVLHKEFTLKDVKIQGIDELSIEYIKEVKNNNRLIKLLGEYKNIDGKEELRVFPEVLETDEFMSKVNGTNKAIEFITKEMGSIFCAGGASDPMGAAAAVLKDVINIIKV